MDHFCTLLVYSGILSCHVRGGGLSGGGAEDCSKARGAGSVTIFSGQKLGAEVWGGRPTHAVARRIGLGCQRVRWSIREQVWFWTS